MELAVFVLLLALTGVLAGWVGSLTGLGGAVVALPVLVIAFGVPFSIAAGTGLITVLATSSTTGAAYVRDRLSDLRIGMFLEIATVPGALLGAVATVVFVHASLSAALLVGLGAVLLAILPGTILRGRRDGRPGPPPDAWSTRLGLAGEYRDGATGTTVPYAAGSTRPALAVAFGAGVVAGMFGLGGGVFKVHALERYLGLPMKVATATSNFMIGVTAAAGAGVMLEAGFVNAVIAAPVAIGTAAGAFFGSRLLPELPNRTVRWVFLPAIAALAVEVILRGLGLP